MSDYLFTMRTGGISNLDEPKLREIAQGPSDGAMQPYFATIILQLYDMMVRGELKGRSPSEIKVVLTQ